MQNHRLMVTMDIDQIKTLDDFSMRCKLAGGRKLSRTCIIRALARVAKDLGINTEGCCSEEEFEERVWEAIEKCQKN